MEPKWLYLKNRKQWINFSLVGFVYDLLDESETSRNSIGLTYPGFDEDIIVSDNDAEKIREYLNRIAYA